MKTWKNITEVKKANKELGNHWFEASAMRFFETRIESKIICGNLFITSEVTPHGEKKFSIREVNDDGSINTLGSFHSFATKADALEVARS